MKFRPSSSIDRDAPDWRWGQACFEMDKETAGGRDYEPSSDMYVGILKKYLRLSRCSKMPSDRLRMLMPDLSFLVDIYNSSGYACARHTMEALAMAGADAAFIGRNISKRLGSEMVVLYKKMFFDIEGMDDYPMWLERNVLAPFKKVNGDDEWFSGFGWKVLGYYGGLDKLLKFGLRSRREMTKEDLAWMKSFALSQNRTSLLTYIYKRGTVSRQGQANEDIAGRMMIDWENAETKMEEGLKNLADGSLPLQMQAAMKKMVAVKEPDRNQDKMEIIDVSKYTTEEPKT